MVEKVLFSGMLDFDGFTPFKVLCIRITFLAVGLCLYMCLLVISISQEPMIKTQNSVYITHIACRYYYKNDTNNLYTGVLKHLQ